MIRNVILPTHVKIGQVNENEVYSTFLKNGESLEYQYVQVTLTDK